MVTHSSQQWPNITICSLKKFDASALKIMNDVISGTSGGPPKSAELTEWKTKFEEFQENAEKLIKSYGNAILDAQKIADVNAIYSWEGMVANFDEQVLKNAAARDYIVDCNIVGNHIAPKGCKMSTKFDRKNGMCYTVNPKMDDIMPPREKHVELIISTVASASQDMLDVTPLGISADALKNLGPEEGVKIILDDSDGSPEQFEVRSGNEIEVRLKRTEVKRLQQPYGECEKGEVYGNDCLDKCYEHMFLMYCGCIPLITGRATGQKFCSKLPDVRNKCDPSGTLSTDCKDMVKNFRLILNCSKTGFSTDLSCHCPAPCEDTQYNILTTSFALNGIPPKVSAYWNSMDDNTKNDIQSLHTNFDLKSLSTKIRIKLDITTTESVQVAAMTIASLLRDIYFHFMITILVLANLIYAICGRNGK